MSEAALSRADLRLIASWVAPNSRVLDLGCGDGELMQYLRCNKDVQGYGIEIDTPKVARCIERGINVIQTDLDNGLGHFPAKSFEYVILSLTLQAVHQPHILLEEMLRVGQQCIVTFPNFAHWKNRFQLLFGGKMPIGSNLPYAWYQTPNIHLCTVSDFSRLCKEKNYHIESLLAMNANGKRSRWLPNILGEIAVCRISNPMEQTASAN